MLGLKKISKGFSLLLVLCASNIVFAEPATGSASNRSDSKPPSVAQAGAAQPANQNTTATVNTVEEDQADAVTKDPYERFNRVMFQFNEVVDKLILRPVATLYIKIVPKPLSKGLSNFYNNIDTIPTVANDFLQANFYQGTSDAWRLAINSTVGILGLFDVATPMGLEPNKEDFGLTLAQWGYRDSNYLVLPFLGPGTVRDQLGWPVNYFYLTIYPYIDPVETRNELYFTGVVVKRAELLRYQNVLEEASLDDYVFIRNAYLQRRAYLLERNAELNDPYLEKNKQSDGDETSTTDQSSTSTTAEQSSPSPAQKVS